MKDETENDFLQHSQSNIRPAPSLRVPVTADNREFLRWLRAAELSAWEAGRATAFCWPPRNTSGQPCAA